MDNDDNGPVDNSPPKPIKPVNSSEMFEGYFGDENKRSVGKTPKGSTLELASFDSEISSQGAPINYEEENRKVSTANFSLSTLELDVTDDIAHLAKPTMNPPSAKLDIINSSENKSSETIEDDILDVPDVLIVSEDKPISLGVEAKAMVKDSYKGPVFARHQEDTFFEKLRDNYKAMMIIGAVVSLLLGFGVALYYSNSALQKDVKSNIIKQEVATRGAILLNDGDKIESFKKKEKSARTAVAWKTGLMWFVFSGGLMGAWYKFALRE